MTEGGLGQVLHDPLLIGCLPWFHPFPRLGLFEKNMGWFTGISSSHVFLYGHKNKIEKKTQLQLQLEFLETFKKWVPQLHEYEITREGGPGDDQANPYTPGSTNIVLGWKIHHDLMVFTRISHGDFHGRAVSFREGNDSFQKAPCCIYLTF